MSDTEGGADEGRISAAKLDPPGRHAPSQLRLAFLAFHQANPWVYVRMVAHCRALLARGYKQYSSRTLISVMRFEWDLQTTKQRVLFAGAMAPSAVKLNDHHSPYYARMIMASHPEFADFFSRREVTGEDDMTFPAPPPESLK